MAQGSKSLSCKCEDWSSDSQNSLSGQTSIADTCNPQTQDTDTGNPRGKLVS